MGKFDGIYFFSDVDGTLVTSEYTIPQRNIDAIKYFTANGGRFALATGRGPHGSTFDIAERLGVNFTSILLNGALIYDIPAKKPLNVRHADMTDAMTLLKKLSENFSDSCIITAWLADNAVQLGVIPSYSSIRERGSCESIDGPVVKIVIGHPDGVGRDVEGFVRQNVGSRLYVTNASPRFLEVMPVGVSKGRGLEWLIRRCLPERRRVVAMGDYFNDLSMLSLEGIRAFCPQNAAEEIKKVCECSLCHVDNGAVAEAIELLDSEQR